ncbi:hypothetical protein SAMN04487967_2497 [Natronorubrum sediminis]|uniref:Uncharacterized protein n=1 Tax=Natronorubrum sediminis TaxID=640943 RepID=A0A1H6FZI9_9EURY|nr:hypothetical protein [Natronorubrum sediminis]SEH16217.1 hypothetical protein SAMN04487967_2497 [Natronorubrum sediminis]
MGRRETDRIFGYPRRSVVLESTRVAYSVGITAAVMILVVFSVSWLRPEVLEWVDPAISAAVVVIFPAALTLGLYIYDRRHERDLVIADAALYVVRPIAAVIRLFRGGGS